MKRAVFNPKVTITFADGTVLSDAEFMAQKYPVSYEKNKKLIDDYAFATDPKYRATALYVRKYERTKDRLDQLNAERDELLADLKRH